MRYLASAIRSTVASLDAFLRAERGWVGVLLVEVAVVSGMCFATYTAAQVGLRVVRRWMLWSSGVWDAEGYS